MEKSLIPGGEDGKIKDVFTQEVSALRQFFPMETDTYLDGGAIDNTPSNAAVDFVRE